MTSLKYLKDLTEIGSFEGKHILVIYDKYLNSNPEFIRWKSRFRYTYAVQAGESLKDIDRFSRHVKKIRKLISLANRELIILGVGGGSVTDFSGFLASVLWRGVTLHLIPSTWLAALDSAHGGKNGLNVGEFKNQIGTFYLPEKIYLVKSILMSQPKERYQEAFGELLKTALISGEGWAKRLIKKQRLTREDFWKLLRPVIATKYKIVKKDFQEKNGVRQILNLGHTLGHVLEKNRGLSHGIAVGQGLIFATKWSTELGFLKKDVTENISQLISSVQGKSRFKKIKQSDLMSGLRSDKKIKNSGKINFIFLDGIGKPVCQRVSLEKIVNEAKRQGWVG